MPSIVFKAKVRTMYNMDDTIAYKFVDVPRITRSHCDMQEWRMHPKYGSYANSDLFGNVLARVIRSISPDKHIKLGSEPESVTVATSGFLAVVTISVE